MFRFAKVPRRLCALEQTAWKSLITQLIRLAGWPARRLEARMRASMSRTDPAREAT